MAEGGEFGIRFGDLWRGLNSPMGLLSREIEERKAAVLGLEIRRPFYDRRLVEFLLTVPLRHRVSAKPTSISIGLSWTDCYLRACFHAMARWTSRSRSGATSRLLLAISWTGSVHLIQAGLVDGNAVAQLAQMVGEETLGGWPEYQLWTLFAAFL